MGPCATDVMLILGYIGEVREAAESADDLGRLIVGEGIEDRLELPPRRGVVVAMKADGCLANALDDGEDLLALLLADDVAEDAAEKANVLAERFVLLPIQARSDLGQEILPRSHQLRPRRRVQTGPERKDRASISADAADAPGLHCPRRLGGLDSPRHYQQAEGYTAPPLAPAQARQAGELAPWRGATWKFRTPPPAFMRSSPRRRFPARKPTTASP